MEELKTVFGNDPNNDYALTMEIHHGEEQIIIVKLCGEELCVDFYASSQPVRMPLEWLLARLQEARRDILAGEAVEGEAYNSERTPTAA